MSTSIEKQSIELMQTPDGWNAQDVETFWAGYKPVVIVYGPAQSGDDL